MSVLCVVALAGCDAFLFPAFVPGTYAGDPGCALSVTQADGTFAQEEFDQAIILIIGPDGGITVNDEELVVGGQVLRSIPTADLAFEIKEIARDAGVLTVTYEPKPTLPGISIQGQLVETYRQRNGSVLASANAALVITDVSSTTTFYVQCSGTLASR